MHDRFDFEQLPGPSDYAPDVSSDPPARGSVRLPASPVVTGLITAATLVLAALLFLAALPGEDETLVYQGREVEATDMCRIAGTDRVCLEVAETEVTETGWGAVQIVIALVLTAGAAFLIFQIPKQAKGRGERTRDRIDEMTERRYKRL